MNIGLCMKATYSAGVVKIIWYVPKISGAPECPVLKFLAVMKEVITPTGLWCVVRVI